LLALPRVHLVVDGYNVTKTGYGALPLADQRARLVGALASVAGRAPAAGACVFGGAALGGPGVFTPPPRGRGVFSPSGRAADEVIRRLVAEEPPGRPVVVVSSDREVVDGVRRRGAHPVSSEALLRRLDRA